MVRTGPRFLVTVPLLFSASLLGAAGIWGASELTAQACQIRMERLFSLTGDEVAPFWFARLTADEILLRRDFAPGILAVFEREETDVRTPFRFQRVLGRVGEGPGEFKAISDAFILPEGGMAVFDAGNRRLTYLSADGDVESTHSLPVIPAVDGVVLLEDGSYLVAGRMLSAGNSGSAVVHLDRDGEALGHYGRDLAEREGNLRGRMVPRLIAFHREHRLVTMKRVVDYHIEVWNADGTLREVVALDPEWFEWPPDLSGVALDQGFGPPEDHFMALQLDSQGRLWILAQVTPPDWQEGIEGGEVVDDVKWRDFVIEVVDLDEGKPICTRRFAETYFSGGFVAPGVVKSYREDGSGRPGIIFWRLSMGEGPGD